MVKDVTLFPDQDIIHNDMVRVAYHSKLDMSKAYEQIHIILGHVHNLNRLSRNVIYLVVCVVGQDL